MQPYLIPIRPRRGFNHDLRKELGKQAFENKAGLRKKKEIATLR